MSFSVFPRVALPFPQFALLHSVTCVQLRLIIVLENRGCVVVASFLDVRSAWIAWEDDPDLTRLVWPVFQVRCRGTRNKLNQISFGPQIRIEHSTNFSPYVQFWLQRVLCEKTVCKGLLCLQHDLTLVSCLAYSSTLKMKTSCSQKCRLTFNGLHGVIFQRVEVFIETDVRTSNATNYELFPGPAQKALFRARLVLLFLFSIGSLDFVWKAMGTGYSFYPTGEPMGTDLLSSISILLPI
jgi:hypothetical protein